MSKEPSTTVRFSAPLWKRSLNRLDSSVRRFASAESDEEFIVHLYDELLGRRADFVGLSEGTRNLGLGLMRRGHLRRYIASSSEYRALTTTRESYRELLGRDATGAEERKGARLLIAADQDRVVLEREVREGIEYRTRHDPATVTDRSLAGSLPKEVWLELTTRCNIVPACVMCGYASADSSSPRRDMDPETWRSLLPLLRQARRIGLHGAGEPLLYPFLEDLMEALSASPAVVGFNSNGHLLTAAVSRRLVERLGWISISLDAATARTYLRIRRRPDFDALLSKIQALREIRDAAGSKRPQIEINMTLMKLNLPEAPAFVDLAARLGLDRVMFQEIQPGGSQRVVAPDGFLFDYREQELTGDTRREDVLGKARARAQSLGVQFSYEILYGSTVPAEVLEAAEAAGGIGTRCEGPQPPACGEPWERLLFNVRGDAFVCCTQMVNEVSLGRSPDDSLEQIWNGKRARIVRDAMFDGSSPAFCRGCYRTSGLAPSFALTGG